MFVEPNQKYTCSIVSCLTFITFAGIGLYKLFVCKLYIVHCTDSCRIQHYYFMCTTFFLSRTNCIVFRMTKLKIDSWQKIMYNCCFRPNYNTVVINSNLRCFQFTIYSFALGLRRFLVMLPQSPAYFYV